MALTPCARGGRVSGPTSAEGRNARFRVALLPPRAISFTVWAQIGRWTKKWVENLVMNETTWQKHRNMKHSKRIIPASNLIMGMARVLIRQYIGNLFDSCSLRECLLLLPLLLSMHQLSTSHDSIYIVSTYG